VFSIRKRDVNNSFQYRDFISSWLDFEWLQADGQNYALTNSFLNLVEPNQLLKILDAADNDDALVENIAQIEELFSKNISRVFINLEGTLVGKTGAFRLRFNKDTKYTPYVSEIVNAEIEVGPKTPIKIGPATFALIVFLSECDRSANKDKRIDGVSALKRLKKGFPDLYSHIKYDGEYLESVNIDRINKLKPYWQKKSNGNFDLKFNCELQDDRKTSANAVSTDSLIRDSSVLKLGGSSTDFVQLNDAEKMLIEGSKRFRNQPEAAVKAVIDRPELLIPPGHCPESLDLSDYSPRVLGFEVCTIKPGFDGLGSGVCWFKSDDIDTNSFSLTFTTQDQSDPVVLKFSSAQDLQQAFADVKKQVEKSQDLNAPDFPEVVKISGLEFTPNHALLDQLGAAAALATGQEDRKNKVAEPKKEGAGKAKAKINEKLLSNGQNLIALDSTSLGAFLRKDKLYAYQEDGLRWLTKHYNIGCGGALLADDMGLGKTLQLLSLAALVIASNKINKIQTDQPILVVTPVNLLRNWKKEIEKFFKEGVFGSVLCLHGPTLDDFKTSSRTGLEIDELKKHSLILTNYHTLASWQRDLMRIDYAGVFFDESQFLKNPDAAVSRAARGLKSRFIVCSTGTPVENRLLDLWTEVDVLQRVPKHPYGDRVNFVKTFEKDENTQRIRELSRYPSDESFILRRDKSIIEGLPKKHILVQKLPMTQAQWELEKIIERDSSPLAKLQKLQLLYQHPELLRPVVKGVRKQTSRDEEALLIKRRVDESPKLKWLIQLLREIETKGEKVLVFALHTRMQVILKSCITDLFGINVSIINGATNQKGPDYLDGLLDRFSSTKGFGVLVLSPVAAGAGLNITAANHVVHFGRWWNPAKEDQASDRAYRNGQKKDVTIYYPTLHSPADDMLGFDLNQTKIIEQKRSVARDFLAPTEDLEMPEEDTKPTEIKD
jgi:hypothetical protein